MVPQRLEPASRPPASPLGSCSCPITQGHPLPLLATSLPHPPPLLPLLTNPVKAQDDGASSSFDAPQPWPDDLRRNVCWQSRAVLCDGTRFLSLGSAGGFPYCKLLWAFWPSSKKPLSLSLSPHPLVFKFLVRRHGGGNPARAWAPHGLHIMNIGDANADRTAVTPHNLGVAAWN